MKKEAMRMERVTYISQDMKLLDNFNFQLFQGEIMGLMPMDSIGLDAFITLTQFNNPILYGYVYLNEELVNSCLADVHTVNNVYYISHESNLVHTLSAGDNVFMLRRGYRGIYLKNRILEQQLRMILQELNIEMDVTKSLDKMTLFEKYLLEIVKGVISKATVIIIRSLGSLVNDWDLKKLMKVIQYYKKQGFSFIYISVDQEEIADYCDRVSFMSEGRIKKVMDGRDFSTDSISRISPSHFQNRWRVADFEKNDAPSVCEFHKVSYHNIKNLSFSVKKGECLVLADISNRIQGDIVELMLGKSPYTGQVIWGKGKRGKEKKRAVSVIMENPLQTMIYPEMSYASNLCLNIDHKIGRVWRDKFLRDNITKEVLEGEEIDPEIPVKYLSNRQKYQLVYASVLLQHPDVVFCINPFLNVDIDLMDNIQKWIQKLLQAGIAVVITTVNYHPMLPVTDRLMILGERTENILFEKEEVQGMIH